MILIGFHSTGGYKLLDPETNQVHIRRDVVIDESSDWTWKNNNQETPQSRIMLEEECAASDIASAYWNVRVRR